MIISECKVQGSADTKESGSNRLKMPLNEQQAQNKDKIVIITLEGTILHDNEEIPNTSFFLNMMKKITNLKLIYLDSIDAKNMKEIKKRFRTFNYPSGEILLKNKHMDVDQHLIYTLERLSKQFNIKLLITSNDLISKISKEFMIPMINTKENTEWDLDKRREIVRFLQ